MDVPNSGEAEQSLPSLDTVTSPKPKIIDNVATWPFTPTPRENRRKPPLDRAISYNQDESIETGCCDPDFAKSVFSIKDVFLPFHSRKSLVWFFYACMIATIIGLEHTVGFTEHIRSAIEYHHLALMIFIYSVDPALTVSALIFAKYPKVLTEEQEQGLLKNEDKKDIALLISCHNSADVVAQNVKAALVHLAPEQIFIIDNGNTQKSTDERENNTESNDERLNK